MNDRDCIQFLQWALPKLRMQWKGFRKVRGQVCKRIDRRLRELGLANIASYRSCLEDNPAEWPELDSLCSVTISRFFRDKAVFQFLERVVVPRIASLTAGAGTKDVNCWSIGCASGEEPYTLALLWNFSMRRRFPDMRIRITATDSDRTMIGRALAGCYPYSSIKELPEEWLARGFSETGDGYCIKDEEREKVLFVEQDVRTGEPDGTFHLILCRNAVFTYFDNALQCEILERIRKKIAPGGALVLGIHESLPQGATRFEPWSRKLGVYRAVGNDQHAATYMPEEKSQKGNMKR